MINPETLIIDALHAKLHNSSASDVLTILKHIQKLFNAPEDSSTAAVERLLETVEHDQDSWLRKVLPSLNQYLMVDASPSWESENIDAQSLKSKLKVIDLDSQMALTRRPSKLTSSEDVQSLRELQLRILRLLGRQAQHNRSILSRQTEWDGSKGSSDLFAWDPEPRVKLLGQVESTKERSISIEEGLISDLKLILQNFTIMFTPLIGSILHSFYESGLTDISPELISEAAIRSSNQYLGIILLEKQIMQYGAQEPSPKRQKSSGSGARDLSRKNWIELARMYKSIDEKVIVKSILRRASFIHQEVEELQEDEEVQENEEAQEDQEALEEGNLSDI
ncbi:hypothetical protein BGZ65_009885 [Modicella reniformis]|uniref:DNA-dependent protein kinase catalytic subunit CC5 domain-containing protein n=1 Tax=Modicella reniformis TaxID=1440133 RepID=A0A9P6IIA6_9FUNG|nr:hypothetical protein BGZ65_009885 [Modicella reniformis]